jgi:hypothetical protein
MCNARNHWLGCSCGFGGEGHLGRAINNGPRYVFTKAQKYGFEPWGRAFTSSSMSELAAELGHSIVFPAHCRYCDVQIYLFASPNGGRAVFNDLGPPWPKHWCEGYELNKVINCILASQTLAGFTFPIPRDTLRKTDPFPTSLSGIVVRSKSRQLQRTEELVWEIDIFDGRILYHISVSEYFPIGAFITGTVVNNFGEIGTYLKNATGYLPPEDDDSIESESDT